MSRSFSKFIVIGGGIAGVTVVSELSQRLPSASILLISASDTAKFPVNVTQVTQNLDTFDVAEQPLEKLLDCSPNVSVMKAWVASIDSEKKIVRTTKGQEIKYERICFCTGAIPKLLVQNHPNIIGIRDTDSVLKLASRLSTSRRVLIVGNGGIALELVHAVQDVEIIWSTKDAYIGNTFFDATAADFFMPELKQRLKTPFELYGKTTKINEVDMIETELTPIEPIGTSMGPKWLSILQSMTNTSLSKFHYWCKISKLPNAPSNKNQDIVSQSIIKQSGNWPLLVRLTNGAVFGCDIIISCIGVVPNCKVAPIECLVNKDFGGFIKNSVCVPYAKGSIFAAGDCTFIKSNENWFQMKLWSQARTAGSYAAQCMADQVDCLEGGMRFELFSHVTSFFDRRVVLLASSSKDADIEVIFRITSSKEYIKVVFQYGRVVGAVLIGDTGLEETIENLILDRLDVRSVFRGDCAALLDPRVDVEDFFD
eukprot:GSMAST32.ASY1.ANO1.1874.1 assembled CDS